MGAAEDIYTVEELKALTRAKQRAKVIEVLARNRIPFIIAADGWPSVDRRWMPGGNVVSLNARRSEEPDFDALT